MNIDWNYYRDEKQQLPSAATLQTVAEAGETFPDWAIRELLWNYQVEMEESDYGYAGRWSIGRSFIVTFDSEHYYRVYYEEGLTEYQENEYYSQVLEPVQKVHKVIEIDVWEAI